MKGRSGSRIRPLVCYRSRWTVYVSTKAITESAIFALGAVMAQWGIWQRSGPINAPHGIAVDADGSVYVCDLVSGVRNFRARVVCRPWGQRWMRCGQLDYPSGVAVGAGGVVRSERGREQIQQMR